MTAVRRIAGALRGLPVHAKGTRDRMTMPILTREPGRGAGTRTRARADRAPCACRTPATGATRADGKAVPRTGECHPDAVHVRRAGRSCRYARRCAKGDGRGPGGGAGRSTATAPAHERHADRTWPRAEPDIRWVTGTRARCALSAALPPVTR